MTLSRPIPLCGLRRNRDILRLVGWVSRWGVGLSLLLASLPKLRDPAAFHEHVAVFGLLNDGAAEMVAWALPVFELVVGLSLWSGVWLAGGMLWAIVMLAGFSGLQLWAWTTGVEAPCGCFSLEQSEPISGWSFARAAGLLLLALAGGPAVFRWGGNGLRRAGKFPDGRPLKGHDDADGDPGRTLIDSDAGEHAGVLAGGSRHPIG